VRRLPFTQLSISSSGVPYSCCGSPALNLSFAISQSPKLHSCFDPDPSPGHCKLTFPSRSRCRSSALIPIPSLTPVGDSSSDPAFLHIRQAWEPSPTTAKHFPPFRPALLFLFRFHCPSTGWLSVLVLVSAYRGLFFARWKSLFSSYSVFFLPGPPFYANFPKDARPFTFQRSFPFLSPFPLFLNPSVAPHPLRCTVFLARYFLHTVPFWLNLVYLSNLL